MESQSTAQLLSLSTFVVKRHDFPPHLVLPASVHAAAAIDAQTQWPSYDFTLETEVSKQFSAYEKQKRAAKEDAARAAAQAEADRRAAKAAADAARLAEEEAAAKRAEAAEAAEHARIEKEKEAAKLAEQKHTEDMLQMHSLTSADEDTCRRLLKENGTLQKAIQAFFHEQETEARRAARAAESNEMLRRNAEDRTRQDEEDRLLAQRLKKQGSAALDDYQTVGGKDDAGNLSSATSNLSSTSTTVLPTSIQSVNNPFGASNPFVDANPFVESPSNKNASQTGDFPPPSYPQPPSYHANADVPPPSYRGSGGGSGNDLGNHTVSRLPSNPATEDRESKSAMYKEYSSKISQLVGLTQKSEAECRHMLEQKDFDVQRAINAFFNGEFLS